jgi:hypothetical protein
MKISIEIINAIHHMQYQIRKLNDILRIYTSYKQAEEKRQRQNYYEIYVA